MKTFSLFAALCVALVITIAVAHGSNNDAANGNHASDGAFQDGTYLGRLAAQRGEAAHIASGRWATAADRKSFADGYAAAYDQALALILEEKLGNQSTGAAYRDGLYLGERDAERGRPEHIASGRWAQSQDRESFVAGYTLAYSDTTATRLEKTNGSSQALLVRYVH